MSDGGEKQSKDKAMSMKKFKRIFKNSRLFAFNELDRNAWVTRQAARVPAGSRVLDAGAGSCPYRPLFEHCRYETQDFQALKGEQLNLGAYGQIDYVCDATEIPVPDACFDVVLCTEVLEHVPEPIRVVKEIARILKPGGKLILTAPLGSGIHQEPYHFYGGYTPFWYRKFLGEAGFESITIEPNAGFFRFFSQECIRFLMLSRPFRLHPGAIRSLLWAPLWLLLLPLLGLFIPVLCHFLDRFDTEFHFTVGYHVTATRTADRKGAVS
ncbi:MAG TPA: class I SAM-dependent methyltransferase [Smithella sp.]|jgi:SAM-dependent methyltransferase|nr:class I SAM-dependent methyltransferase [Smithella sp.]HOR33158.1 class I SAM-dependent methyltransferase [Syntrophales bacterium]